MFEKVLSESEQPEVKTALGERLKQFRRGQEVMVATRSLSMFTRARVGLWKFDDGKFVLTFWVIRPNGRTGFEWFEFGEHSDIEIEEKYLGHSIPAIYVQV